MPNTDDQTTTLKAQLSDAKSHIHELETIADEASTDIHQIVRESRELVTQCERSLEQARALRKRAENADQRLKHSQRRPSSLIYDTAVTGLLTWHVVREGSELYRYALSRMFPTWAKDTSSRIGSHVLNRFQASILLGPMMQAAARIPQPVRSLTYLAAMGFVMKVHGSHLAHDYDNVALKAQSAYYHQKAGLQARLSMLQEKLKLFSKAGPGPSSR